MFNILVIEDSEEAIHLVRRSLGRDIQVHWARSMYEGERMLFDQAWDMFIIDVVLPDGDGFHLCSKIQAQPKLKPIPVIFLTGQDALSDKVFGFSVGADDYICKPFEPLELKARVESKLKKSMVRTGDPDSRRFGDVEIHMGSQKVYLWKGEGREEISLTPLEFKLLLSLTRDPERVISREELLKNVWGENVHVFNRSVDTHISKLRKKLQDKSSYIRSVHGTGYQFIV